jgi:hypothetical protein
LTTPTASPLTTRLLPPPTNQAYQGSLFAAHLLAVLGVLTVVPGCIHSFLPDGGAATIAGIDLGACRSVIVALFAWAGATQIVFGLTMLLAGTRYRTFVPLVLSLVILERGLHAVEAWLPKDGGAHHHPPEHYAVLLVLPLAIAALVLSLRDRSAPAATTTVVESLP